MKNRNHMSAQDDAIARYRSGMNKDLSEAYNLCSRKRHTIVKKPKNRIGRSIIWRLGQLFAFANNTGPHKSSRKVQEMVKTKVIIDRLVGEDDLDRDC
jgi:hypothetical protein